MPGTLTIARKEFVDHVSDHTFLLCFGIFLVAMVASTFYQLDQIYQLMAYIAPTVGFLEKELWRDPEVSEMLQTVLASQLSTLGVLVALTLSFNSINKERVEGSLKVLFSYPISRSKIIMGKLIAGLAVVTLVVIASLTISFGIEMYYLTIPLTEEVFLRLAAVTVYGIVLLAFFLSLGTAVSIIVKDASTTLLILLIVAVLLQPDFVAMTLVTLAVLMPRSVTYNAGSNVQYYSPGMLSWQMPSVLWWLHKDYLRMTPIVAFRTFSGNIFHFQNVYPYYTSRTSPQIITLPFDWLLTQNIPLLVAPILYTIGAVMSCFILFNRRDIV